MRIFKIFLAGLTALSMNTALVGSTIVGGVFVVGMSAAEAQVYPNRVYRGGRGYGRGVGAAAVGLGVLGVLGAAAAASAASQPPAVYEDDCPLVRRRIYLDDGSYVIRRVPAC